MRRWTLIAVMVLLAASTAPTLAQEHGTHVTTVVRSGEVLRVVGNTLVVRVDGEGIQTFRNVPLDFRFLVNGREMSVTQLRPGMRLTETRIITTHTPMAINETEVEQVMDEPDPAPAAAPAPAPAPAPKPAAKPAPMPSQLPSTGGPLPALALLGLGLTAVGAGLTGRRRLR